MHRLLRTTLGLLALAALFSSGAGAAGDGPERLALVVGNARLGSQRVLDPAPRDVQAVSAALRAAGFLVMVREDIGADALRGTLDEFRARLRPDGIGLIYLATLGAQVEGRTLLLMRDTPLPAADKATPATVAAALQAEAVELAEVLLALAGSKGPIGPRALVLDAAWQHPLLDRLPQRGLAEATLPPGVAVLFGSPPGQTQVVPLVGAVVVPEGALPTAARSPRDLAATAFARQLATRIGTPGLRVGELLRAVKQDLADTAQAGTGRTAPWYGGDTDASLPMAEPLGAATAAAPLDGRTRPAGGERGERPVFTARRNTFGHGEGDVFVFRRSDSVKAVEIGVETLFIEAVAADGTLQANGAERLLDAQGRTTQERSSNGNGSVSTTHRFAPAQELWWAAPVQGQRRKVAFVETVDEADGRRARFEWAGTAEVGAPRLLALPAGEIEALPVHSRGTTHEGAAGAALVLRSRWVRTVWVAPRLGHPVAIEIEDDDAQGQPLKRERLELMHAQTSRDAR